MPHYLSLQYSAIQKTVLRHDRLWSIAGISQGLARLNEVTFMKIAEQDCNGKVLVAGGGKFTARFDRKDMAEKARSAIVQKLAVTFPMLEFQLSEIFDKASFKEAKDAGIIDSLNDQKRTFRGYATSYLPHLSVCGECGEYPAEQSFSLVREKKKINICRTCHETRSRVWTNLESLSNIKGDDFQEPTEKQGNQKPQKQKNEKHLTTLERIYAGYLRCVKDAATCELALDFSDLFQPGEMKDKSAKRRMAVWFSDLNSMNKKVPIWLAQKEDAVLDTFNKVKDVNIAVVVAALAKTFDKPEGNFLPFRMIVAGGDDLCLVMPEQYILSFAQNLAVSINEKIIELDKDIDNPLNTQWLKKNAREDEESDVKELKPYSFGGAFVIASLHTPFKKIHELGEELMSTAKKATDRQGNSVNWRIMAEEHSVTDALFKFDRPLFMSPPAVVPAGWEDRLTFSDYLELRDKFRSISSSHRFAVIEQLKQNQGDPGSFAIALKKLDGATRNKSFSGLLVDNRLKRGESLDPVRFATLLEILSIKTQ